MDEPGICGKVAIVAGGSLGIGEAAARRIAAGGGSVSSAGGGKRLSRARLRSSRAPVFRSRVLPPILAESADAEKVVAFTVEHFGGIDILVNSAGIQRYGTVVDTDEATWDEVFAINVKGMYLMAHFAIPEMRKRGGGSIINVSSVQAFASQKQVAAYTASKGAINALTRAMALDHAEEQIPSMRSVRVRSTRRCCAISADLFKGDHKVSGKTLAAWDE